MSAPPFPAHAAVAAALADVNGDSRSPEQKQLDDAFVFLEHGNAQRIDLPTLLRSHTPDNEKVHENRLLVCMAMHHKHPEIGRGRGVLNEQSLEHLLRLYDLQFFGGHVLRAVENDGRTLHFCVEPGPWTKLTNRTDHFTFTVSPEHNKTLMQLMQSAENLLTTLLGKHRP